MAPEAFQDDPSCFGERRAAQDAANRTMFAVTPEARMPAVAGRPQQEFQVMIVIGRITGDWPGQRYFAARASTTGGVTNFDTSPPSRAISLTSFDAIACRRASAIMKTVSMLASSARFMPTI